MPSSTARRALGATRPAILRYFMLENFLISSIGVIGGAVLAVGLNIWMVQTFNLRPLAWYMIPAAMLLLWLVGQAAVFGPAREPGLAGHRDASRLIECGWPVVIRDILRHIRLIAPESRMVSAAFIFRPGEYDQEFHTLNDLIDSAAKATAGYIGRESWQSPDGKTLNATYYWESLEALAAFSGNKHHLEAKKNYRQWYEGYHIVVAEVIRSYGDRTIPHPTPHDHRK